MMNSLFEVTKEQVEAKIALGEKMLHDLEFSGLWKKQKENWRQLKKAVVYWKDYLKKNF